MYVSSLGQFPSSLSNITCFLLHLANWVFRLGIFFFLSPFWAQNEKSFQGLLQINIFQLLFKVTPEEIRNYVNGQVIDYKQIRGDILFKTEIPHNSVGKLLRREMRSWAETQATKQ